jgi:hypothetical protein
VLRIYYIADNVSQVKQFLADFFNFCRVVKISDNYSVCSFLFKLVCVVEYIVFFEVLDEFSVCFRRCTTEFDNIVCQAFCAILLVLCYVSYAFYHFPIIDNSVDENGWWSMIL